MKYEYSMLVKFNVISQYLFKFRRPPWFLNYSRKKLITAYLKILTFYNLTKFQY